MSRRKPLKTGDRVVIRSGRDGGAEGTVMSAMGCAVLVRLDARPHRTGVTVSLLPSSVKKIPTALQNGNTPE